MNFKELSIAESIEAMEKWKSKRKIDEKDEDYIKLGKEINRCYKSIFKDSSNKYRNDVEFGIELYEMIKKLEGFNMRVASNIGFWRYLSIKVAPEPVEERWGKGNDDHMWKKPSRIWYYTLWWYIHLSWQGDSEKTKELLLKPMFTTDEILNLVERSGKSGYNVELCRKIMLKYSNIPLKKIKSMDALFRKIMVVNTAHANIIEPELYEGGIDSYIDNLLKEIGVR